METISASDRSAFRLAARLIEEGLEPDPLSLGADGAPVAVALSLARSLQRATSDSNQRRAIAQSLRAAAHAGPADRVAAALR